MLGNGEDLHRLWDIPPPDDAENGLDGDFMRLLACSSDDFDVFESGFSEGCLNLSYAPAEEQVAKAEAATDSHASDKDHQGTSEPQQPPRKKRGRAQPVSAEVASSRLEKTRARNRRAQAKFREKKKVERQQLETTVASASARLQAAQEHRGSLKTAQDELKSRLHEVTAALANLLCPRSQPPIPQTAMVPHHSGSAPAAPPLVPIPPRPLFALRTATTGGSQPGPARKQRLRPRVHGYFPSRWSQIMRFEEYVFYETVSADTVIAADPQINFDDLPSALPEAARRFMAAKAAQLTQDATEVCWWYQTSHVVDAAAHTRLSFSVSIASCECMASMFLYFFMHALEGCFLLEAKSILEGAATPWSLESIQPVAQSYGLPPEGTMPFLSDTITTSEADSTLPATSAVNSSSTAHSSCSSFYTARAAHGQHIPADGAKCMPAPASMHSAAQVRCGRGGLIAASTAVAALFHAVVDRYEGLIPRDSIRRILLQLRTLLVNMAKTSFSGGGAAGAAQHAARLTAPELVHAGGSGDRVACEEIARCCEYCSPSAARAAAEHSRHPTAGGDVCRACGRGLGPPEGKGTGAAGSGEGGESKVSQSIQGTMEALMTTLHAKLAGMAQHACPSRRTAALREGRQQVPLPPQQQTEQREERLERVARRIREVATAWGLALALLHDSPSGALHVRMRSNMLSSCGVARDTFCEAENRNMRIYHSLKMQPQQLEAVSGMWDAWRCGRIALNTLLSAAHATLACLPDASTVPPAAAAAVAAAASGGGGGAAASPWPARGPGPELLGMSAASTEAAVRAVAQLEHVMVADKDTFCEFVVRTALPSSVLAPWQVLTFSASCVKQGAFGEVLRLIQFAALEHQRMTLLGTLRSFTLRD
eukprot:jgi/Ulvmu1/7164/UM034_0072.1